MNKLECDEIVCERYGQNSIVSSKMVGANYYAAVNKDNKVVAVMVHTRISGRRFYYTALEESENIFSISHNCPESILSILSPTNNKTAQIWRMKCWENIRKDKERLSLKKLPVGSIISFHSIGEGTRYLLKDKGRKRTLWRYSEYYNLNSKNIPENYEVVYVGNGIADMEKVRTLWKSGTPSF